MSIESQISDFLIANKISPTCTTPQWPNHLYSLDDSQLVVCERFIKQLRLQGVSMGQGHHLSKCMRIVQAIPKAQRVLLTLLAPVYTDGASQLLTTVVIKVSVPSNSLDLHVMNSRIGGSQMNGPRQSLREGEFLLVDPLRIWDFDFPCPEFRLERYEILTTSVSNSPVDLIINPFDYVDTRGMGSGVYRSSSLSYARRNEKEDLIPLNTLHRIMANLCRLMQPADLMLLDAVVSEGKRLQQFFIAPASTYSHHNYRHGLLRHTVQTCIRILYLLAINTELKKYQSSDPTNPNNRSFLPQSGSGWASWVGLGIWAGTLHDFGKIDEYEDLGNGAYALSDSGLFLGHQLKVCLWVYHAAKSSGYSEPDRLMELIHCLSAVERHHDQCGLRTRKTFISKIVNQADRFSAGHGDAFVHEFCDQKFLTAWSASVDRFNCNLDVESDQTSESDVVCEFVDGQVNQRLGVLNVQKQ